MIEFLEGIARKPGRDNFDDEQERRGEIRTPDEPEDEGRDANGDVRRIQTRVREKKRDCGKRARSPWARRSNALGGLCETTAPRAKKAMSATTPTIARRVVGKSSALREEIGLIRAPQALGDRLERRVVEIDLARLRAFVRTDDAKLFELLHDLDGPRVPDAKALL